MSSQFTTRNDTPIARVEFAQRLRELRVLRGYRTARSFARALAVDENRYTRYERAEVEPDLTMIRLICEILEISPDELLSAGRGPSRVIPEPSRAKPAHLNGSQHALPSRSPDIQTHAWMLAEAVTDLCGDRTDDGELDSEAPLAPVVETCKVYTALMERPFESISELLLRSDMAQVDVRAASLLRDSIDQFISTVKARD